MKMLIKNLIKINRDLMHENPSKFIDLLNNTFLKLTEKYSKSKKTKNMSLFAEICAESVATEELSNFSHSTTKCEVTGNLTKYYYLGGEQEFNFESDKMIGSAAISDSNEEFYDHPRRVTWVFTFLKKIYEAWRDSVLINPNMVSEKRMLTVLFRNRKHEEDYTQIIDEEVTIQANVYTSDHIIFKQEFSSIEFTYDKIVEITNIADDILLTQINPYAPLGQRDLLIVLSDGPFKVSRTETGNSKTSIIHL